MATILVVDDAPANRSLVMSLLGGQGHRLLEAGDGHEALALAGDLRPDFIIADVLMPGMDGYELARRLRAHPALAQTKVIFWTSDYPERESLETKIAGRTRELQSANEELEAFSYSVSHDLRAPLRHILGYVNLLKSSLKDKLPANETGYMDAISESANQMTQLIDNLLEFSRMGRVELSRGPVDLNLVVQESIAQLEPETRDRAIVWKATALPEVIGDAAMLRQVFLSLLSNAIKYTRPRDPAQIEIGLHGRSDNQAVIFVRDNGVGFDMEYADKLFGVFQRMHSADEFEGTGIGLANVRRIITRLGGRTWAESKVDSGATFYFSLPFVKSPTS